MAEFVTRTSNAPAAPSVEFRREDLSAPVVQHLISALNAELEAHYPEEGANFFRLDPKEVSEGRGVFLVAYLAGAPVGCGAVRTIEPGVAEIKRMYVDPNVRGFVITSETRRAAPGENYVSNSGVIEALRGYISLGGPGAVVQSGVLQSSTSVARNGFIRLSGTDVQIAPDAARIWRRIGSPRRSPHSSGAGSDSSKSGSRAGRV